MGSKALHLVTRQKKYIVGGILKLKNAMVNMRLLWTIQVNLDLTNPVFPFLSRRLFDLWRKSKNGRLKKVSYLAEFASWNLSWHKIFYWFILLLHAQNGWNVIIYVWSKINDENWFRTNIFEIHPCELWSVIIYF